ncbi:RNA polymerase sigma factor [Apibacter sp. HY039]|uniref:RNA polymerase sigma factor n=1 Tax=Apibacter sp. HY039 TaxID=2501476 RepID=UPI000FEB7662|nr:sigma-70 family RNA polymerase sigma factor [Apibacter sp. HY039]
MQFIILPVINDENVDLLELIEEAKNSRQQAQSKLVNLFWADIKGYIFSLVKEDDAAEELTVETFTKILQKLSLYNSDFDFKTWLISVAHNSTIDYLRKKSKDRGVHTDEYPDLEDTGPSPEQLFINRQNLEALEHKLESLPGNYRKLVQLRYLEGKKLNDIVEETGLSLANVKVSLMRAKKLLVEMQETKKLKD